MYKNSLSHNGVVLFNKATLVGSCLYGSQASELISERILSISMFLKGDWNVCPPWEGEVTRLSLTTWKCFSGLRICLIKSSWRSSSLLGLFSKIWIRAKPCNVSFGESSWWDPWRRGGGVGGMNSLQKTAFSQKEGEKWGFGRKISLYLKQNYEGKVCQ